LDTLSNLINVINTQRGNPRGQRAALLHTCVSVHSSNPLSILQNVFISLIHVLNNGGGKSRHAYALQVLPEALSRDGACLKSMNKVFRALKRKDSVGSDDTASMIKGGG
jgi:uncharacterized protein YjhX (UPF0386 family)